MRTCNLCRIECFYNYVYTFLFYYGVISRFIAYSSSLFLLNISLFQLCLKYIQYSICVKRSVRCSKPKLFYCIIYELIPLGGRFSPWIWWQNQHVIHVRELLVFGDCWPNLLVVFLFRLYEIAEKVNLRVAIYGRLWGCAKSWIIRLDIRTTLAIVSITWGIGLTTKICKSRCSQCLLLIRMRLSHTFSQHWGPSPT